MMRNITGSFKIFSLLFAALVLFTTASCHKEGVGGKGSIKGVVEHHGTPIPNSVVYIKYGATEFPGAATASYDAQVTADGSGNYEFKELYKGDYYLYGVGFDNTISELVSGGISVNLKRNKTATINVPVTE